MSVWISTPSIAAGDFRNSVVWRSPANGQGFILNQPTELDFVQLTQQIGESVAAGAVSVYCGGPVNPHSIYCLHDTHWRSSSTTVHEDIAVSSDAQMIQRTCGGDVPSVYQYFRGSSHWQPGQFEFEQHQGWWMNLDQPVSRVMCIEPNSMYNWCLDQYAQHMYAQYI